ncbi:MAG: tetratricopeptide repeat protein [Verrucomicrobiales bacterium]
MIRCLASLLLLVMPLPGQDKPAVEKAGSAAPHPPSVAMRTRIDAHFKARLSGLDAAVAKNPDLVELRSRRGDTHLFLAHFPEAVADFEKMVALDSAQDAPHWRLGIAYYFAGAYEKSARQFAKYHAFDGRDRENGIWKFLAQVKAEGIDKARREMLVYTKFDREPFPSLYEMFAGRTTADDVLAEIKSKGLVGNDSVEFFAHYYSGLNEEILGRRERSRDLLGKAVASPLGRELDEAPYMWQVARLHFDWLEAAGKPGTGAAAGTLKTR